MSRERCEICNGKIGMLKSKVVSGVGHRIICTDCIKAGKWTLQCTVCEKYFTPNKVYLTEDILKPLPKGSEPGLLLDKCPDCYVEAPKSVIEIKDNPSKVKSHKKKANKSKIPIWKTVFVGLFLILLIGIFLSGNPDENHNTGQTEIVEVKNSIQNDSANNSKKTDNIFSYVDADAVIDYCKNNGFTKKATQPENPKQPNDKIIYEKLLNDRLLSIQIFYLDPKVPLRLLFYNPETYLKREPRTITRDIRRLEDFIDSYKECPDAANVIKAATRGSIVMSTLLDHCREAVSKLQRRKAEVSHLDKIPDDLYMLLSRVYVKNGNLKIEADGSSIVRSISFYKNNP